MIKISIRLHDYLRKISKQKKSEWPVYLNKFLNEYGIKKKCNLIDSIDVVRKVMSEYYGADFSDRFWQCFYDLLQI